MKTVPRTLSVMATLTTTILLAAHPSASARPHTVVAPWADDSPEPSAEPSGEASPAVETSAEPSAAVSALPEASAEPSAAGVRPHVARPKARISPSPASVPFAGLPGVRPAKILPSPHAKPARVRSGGGVGVTSFAPATPFAPALPAIPGLPAPGEAAAVPQIAPSVSPSPVPSASQGISELTTIAPAGALRAGRNSWATMVAIAIVGEAGLLWLFAGLTMWRRRRAGGEQPARRRWPGIPRILR